MSSRQQRIPDDLAACQALLREQLDRNESLDTTADEQAETIQQQSKRIEKLENELQLFRRHLFGQRRERFVDDPRQQNLFEVGEAEPENDAADESADEVAVPKRRRGRRPLPDFLPRKTIVYELKGEDLLCPCCGKPRVKVSEKSSEQLEFEPASLYVKQHVRFVYACQESDCDANMRTADKPPQPIEKGLAGPGLLAFVIASKLADHLPLNRLEDILTRHGLHVARSTQCDWMAACATLVEPLYKLLIRETLQSHVLGTDDTTVPVQDPELERTRTGRFWAYVGDAQHPYVCYDFTPSRSRDGPQAFLQDFRTGYLQGDAYAGYVELARQSGGAIQHAGCWAHARRYFDRAREKAPDRAVHEGLAFIQRLYDVENQTDKLSAEQRLATRRERSSPILEEFRRWLGEQNALPSSLLGEAITYTVNQWNSLCLYLQDGRIPIDNNRTENVLRAQVVGRNNWLFVGSEKGGHTAAVLYSLVVSCKRLKIDPFAYVRDVLTRMPGMNDEQLNELLPDRWIAKHPKHRLEHREREANRAEARRKNRRARRRKLARLQSQRKPK